MGIFVEFALPIFKTISILILIVAYLVWLERKVAAKNAIANWTVFSW